MDQNLSSLTNIVTDPFFQILYPICCGFFITFITISLIYRRNLKLQIHGTLGNIYEEMKNNQSQLSLFSTRKKDIFKSWKYYKQFDIVKKTPREFITKCNINDENEFKEIFSSCFWIGDKTVILFHNQRKWAYQFLSDNFFNSFIISGLFQNYYNTDDISSDQTIKKHYDQIHQLRMYYYHCQHFSDETQFIEEIIDEICEYVKNNLFSFLEKSQSLDSFSDNLKIKCVIYPQFDSLKLLFRYQNDTGHVYVLRMPQYFLNRCPPFHQAENWNNYSNFKWICLESIEHIYNERKREIDRLYDTIVPKDKKTGVRMEKIEWVENISSQIKIIDYQKILAFLDKIV